ncbi:hypothetical protein EJ04DRAFT_449821 [Polyplosphaeria fusca]|uniref:Uncharacterized protein n=1 Tax=Polyplosphaeria fusca TaxID=682080 RepID=A0A9P4QNI0_9PLEO|nr:hypothetical protein EJ04DRAFT_449821 [Polyplosphaeria fusca]
MAASGGTGSGEPDMALIGELLEEISRNPPAIGARKLLTEHYISIGWLDAARENVAELKPLAPADQDVAAFEETLMKKPEPPAPAPQSSQATPAVSKPVPAPARARKPAHAPVKLSGNLDSTRQELSQGYTSLRQKARGLLADLLHLQQLQKKNGLPTSKNTSRVQAVVEGRPADSTTKATPPGSARSIARMIQAEASRSVRNGNQMAIELTIGDLEDTMQWIREPHGRPSGADDDAVRDALVKRVRALETALPDELKPYPEIALMHVQHENFPDKTYVNDETMVMCEPVKDIPRENFWVTEDNYAWDMEELVNSISSNGGVMRNPLSRVMFTPKDIRGIVSHPLGKPLAALQVQQHEMSKGVRQATIDHMEKLGKILLDDQTSDQLPSRHAIDEFMAYIATLPELEQKAIDGLKCPAKDTHTGQSYDTSIGEAVRDAKGNRVCFHKTGDFIQQAAVYLRQNRGAPPDTDKCAVM